jgi:anti-anti-sigma factor
MALIFDISKIQGITVIRCRGRIVFGVEDDELRRVILEALNHTNRIVLNLSWVAHIDSSGLGALVSLFVSARNRRAQIKLAALSANARLVLSVTKVNQLFEIYDSTEAAINSFACLPEAAAG